MVSKNPQVYIGTDGSLGSSAFDISESNGHASDLERCRLIYDYLAKKDGIFTNGILYDQDDERLCLIYNEMLKHRDNLRGDIHFFSTIIQDIDSGKSNGLSLDRVLDMIGQVSDTIEEIKEVFGLGWLRK